MLNFCAIAPTPHLNLVRGRKANLTLAHLVETDEEYVAWYNQEANEAEIRIMDNSAFELVQEGKPLYEGDRLVELAHEINANYVVMTDAPSAPAQETVDNALAQAPVLRSNGLGTFFVPQSRHGDIDGLINSIIWGFESPLVDYVALSILSAPTAFGLNGGNGGGTSGSGVLNRYLSRYHLMCLLEREIPARFGITARQFKEQSNTKLHFLGMLDGPNEIELMSHVDFPIDTWDSSGPIWLGLRATFENHSRNVFSKSPVNRYDLLAPTGLFEGKFSSHVDFNFRTNKSQAVEAAKYNLNYVDDLVELYNYRLKD